MARAILYQAIIPVGRKDHWTGNTPLGPAFNLVMATGLTIAWRARPIKGGQTAASRDLILFASVTI
ncbi:MAG TPA: hypothetical protein VE779_15545 [Candidatus Angelobacter sp.]|nr:hypothetical protein [Candidatus Angelobacter sp.]